MTLMWDGAIALLAAVGLTTILWGLAELIFKKRETEPTAVWLLPLHDQVSEIEVQTLLARRRRWEDTSGIVLLDCGLSEENHHRAELFTQRYEGITLLTADELNYYLKQGSPTP